ncbi:MAG: trigger factor [Spirochaetaceae bacterium 4572_59]|nr:MAG: trigger factor [Spirochaetaceae bacterium 4572_59]
MITSKNVEKLENSSVKLSITVGKEYASREYKDLLSKYAKEVQMKGFRKGKVPSSVIERKFGEGIREEAAANLMDKALKAVIEEVEEKPLGYDYPEVQGKPELDPESDFSFDLVYDTFPEVKFGEYKGLEINERQVKILKKHENEELEKIQDQNSVVMDKTDETVEENNIITIDYCEMEGKDEIADTRREDFVFTVGTGYNLYKIDKQVVGMKKGEEKIIRKRFKEDFENKDLAGRNISLKIKVKAVKEKQMPELDDELAQDVNEKFETLEDLRKDIKQQLKDKASDKLKNEKIEQLVDKLLESSDITLPASMIKAELENNWKNFLQQSQTQEEQMLQFLQMQGQTKEQMLENWKEAAEKSLKSQLIFNKIIEDEKIEASDDEMNKEIEKQAEMYNMSVEDLKKSFGEAGLKEYLSNDLKQKKLIDFLLENATVSKDAEKIDYTDLMK